MILYQLPVSLYSAKVRFALALKGCAIELREPPGGSYRSVEYRKLVPAGTIPALVDGDLLLSESDAIIEFVDEVCEGPRLVPGDARQRARVRMLSRYHDLHLEPRVRTLFPRLAVPGPGRTPPPEEVRQLEEKLALIAVSADRDGPFLAGAAASMADCGLAATRAWLDVLPSALGFVLAMPPRVDRAATALAGTAAGPLVSAYRTQVRDWVAARMPR